MTRSNVRRTSVSWLVGLVLLGAASACHTGSTKLGAGDTVNLCDGVEILNGLPEPDIADRQAILDYTAAALRVVDRIEHGKGRQEDLDLLNNVAENIMGRTICALGDAAAMPVRGMLKHYWDEFAYHVEHKQCMVPTYI